MLGFGFGLGLGLGLGLARPVYRGASILPDATRRPSFCMRTWRRPGLGLGLGLGCVLHAHLVSVSVRVRVTLTLTLSLTLTSSRRPPFCMRLDQVAPHGDLPTSPVYLP